MDEGNEMYFFMMDGKKVETMFSLIFQIEIKQIKFFGWNSHLFFKTIIYNFYKKNT